MFQCYSEETIDDRFLDFSIFKENSETKYTDHSSSIKVKKKKKRPNTYTVERKKSPNEISS